MEDERIKIVKNWPKPKSVQGIQVFIGFANFYRQFIRDFSKIVVPFISMLKTTGSSDLTQRDNNDEVVGDGGDKNVSKSKKLKNAKFGIQTRFGAMKEHKFLTPDVREAFNQLRQAFTKGLILRDFDPECHIWIETNASGYAIGKIPTQLTSDQVTFKFESNSTKKSDFGQWHPVPYFSRKIISAETWSKTHDSELLAIVESFKTWRHYLEGCKYEVLVLTNYDNLWQFMDTKSLSSRQVFWAQKLSKYHF